MWLCNSKYIVLEGVLMKSLSFIYATLLVFSLAFANHSKAQSVEEFNHRLDTIYGQGNQDTLIQQVVFGSLEAIAAYKLEGLISKPDRRAIAAVSSQISALEKSKGHQFHPTISEEQRLAQLRAAKHRLKILEGGILKKMGRGTAKLLVRGTQVFLILDVGTRIYILNTLSNKDPGFVPAYTLLCSEYDCPYTINRIIETSNQAYYESRRMIEGTPQPATAPKP